MKKIIPIILCLVLVFNINVLAEDSANTPADTQEMPMGREGRREGGGRPGMEVSGDETTAMPEGEMSAQGGRQEGDMGMEAPTQGKDEIHEGKMASMQDGENAQFENVGQSQPTNSENTEDTAEDRNRMQRGDMGGMGDFMGGMNGKVQENLRDAEETTETHAENGTLGFIKTYSTPITAVILLIFAFIFVIFYKRKSY